MDVVAVGSEDKWTHPPFSGAIEGGYVWGRGALDLKFSVAALLEAVANLLQRRLIFVFGIPASPREGLTCTLAFHALLDIMRTCICQHKACNLRLTVHVS